MILLEFHLTHEDLHLSHSAISRTSSCTASTSSTRRATLRMSETLRHLGNAVVHSVLEAIVQLVRVELGPSIDIARPTEQPIAPPSLVAASVGR